VPPLRERVEDIPLLMVSLTRIQARQMNRPEPAYSRKALERLCDYPWPGNVRELKNLVKRMVILRPGDEISSEEVERLLESARPQGHETGEKIDRLHDAERQHILKALTKTRGVLGGERGAAKLLGLPRSTIQYRIKKLKIKPDDYLSRISSIKT
jgi:DNA-binding NtrC family response regulator